MGVLLGGFDRVEQHSNATIVDTYSSLLILSVAGLAFPLASQLLATPHPSGIQSFSQALVVILLTIYIGLLLFRLKTHHAMTAIRYRKTPSRRHDTDMAETISKVAAGICTAVSVVYRRWVHIKCIVRHVSSHTVRWMMRIQEMTL